MKKLNYDNILAAIPQTTMKNIFLIVLIILANSVFAQVEQKSFTPIQIVTAESSEENNAIPREKKYIKYFTLDDWRKSFNRSFATLLGGAGTTENIGNYASFDPVNGSFNFKGSIPIDHGERKNLSFLSFAVKGNILSDNTAKLFKDTKVNTNTSVGGEYHFWMKIREPSVIVDKSRETVFIVKATSIEQERKQKIKNVKSVNDLKTQKNKLESDSAVVEKMIPIQEKILQNAKNDLVQLTNPTTGHDLSGTIKCEDNPKKCLEDFQKASGSLLKAQKTKDSLDAQKHCLSLLLDSTRLVIDNWDRGLRLEELQKINRESNKKFESVKDSALIAGYEMTWLTLIASIGNAKVYHYKPTVGFSDQITDQNLRTNKFGLAGNLIKKSATSNRLWLINFGTTYGRNNNADTLSTTDVNEEYAYKNAAGDTTRKVISKYSAYTNAIESNYIFLAFGNVYLVFGKKASSLHLFSTYNKPNKHTGFYNIGLGYIASFRSAKKDTPILTTEFYIEQRDLFNSVSTTNLRQRVDAGLKLTLPFNFF